MRYPRILARSDATNHGSPLSSVMTRTVLPSKSKTESALPEVDWIVILVLSVWAMETLPFYRPRPLRSSSPLGAFCFCCRCNYITQGGVFVIIVSVLYRHRSQRGMTCIFVVYRIFYFVISMPPALFFSRTMQRRAIVVIFAFLPLFRRCPQNEKGPQAAAPVNGFSRCIRLA